MILGGGFAPNAPLVVWWKKDLLRRSGKHFVWLPGLLKNVVVGVNTFDQFL